ncbi:MAG: hypothetical protein WC436_03330 [Candidatus Babeliales bacterium]
MNKKFTFLISTLCFCFLSVKCMQEPTPNSLEDLIFDMNKYKIEPELPTDNINFKINPHMGDLIAHSFWVTQYIDRWLANQSSWIEPEFCYNFDKMLEQYTYNRNTEIINQSKTQENLWCNNFTERDKFLLFFAALLLNIGKAGIGIVEQPNEIQNIRNCKYTKNDDGSINFIDRRNYEIIGMQYILRDILNKTEYLQYIKLDGFAFNFKIFFERFELTLEEQKKVALLVGSHKLFTKVYSDAIDKRLNPHAKTSYNNFLIDLRLMASGAGLSDFCINKKMLEMIIALTVADLYARFFPVNQGASSCILPNFNFIQFPARRAYYETELQQRYSYCNNAIPAMYNARNEIIALLPNEVCIR